MTLRFDNGSKVCGIPNFIGQLRTFLSHFDDTIWKRSIKMHEKDSLFPIANSQGRLECKEVWGGIRNRNIEVSAGKVIGSIYSASSEGGKGGDIYYFGVCKDDRISRLAIADVTGHGKAVSEISQYVYDSLKTHI
jgi:hypothetical protein